jgi:hypothetical protein
MSNVAIMRPLGFSFREFHKFKLGLWDTLGPMCYPVIIGSDEVASVESSNHLCCQNSEVKDEFHGADRVVALIPFIVICHYVSCVSTFNYMAPHCFPFHPHCNGGRPSISLMQYCVCTHVHACVLIWAPTCAGQRQASGVFLDSFSSQSGEAGSLTDAGTFLYGYTGSPTSLEDPPWVCLLALWWQVRAMPSLELDA